MSDPEITPARLRELAERQQAFADRMDTWASDSDMAEETAAALRAAADQLADADERMSEIRNLCAEIRGDLDTLRATLAAREALLRDVGPVLQFGAIAMTDDATTRARAKALLTSVLDNDRFDLSADGLADFILEVFDQDDLALYDTRTHAAVPREPSEADVERVARAMFRADAWYGTKSPNEAVVTMTDGEVPGWKIFAAKARAAIAALVAAQTQGGGRDAPP